MSREGDRGRDYALAAPGPRPTLSWSRQRGDHEQLPQQPREQHPYAPRLQIRTFEGDPAQYKEWRREVQIGAFTHSVKDAQLAGLVYLALAPGVGKPRDLFSHYDVINELCTDDGLQTIWKTLDSEYVREYYVKTDEAQARYDRCRRTPGMSMDDFMREAKLSKQILEKEDPGTTISDVAFARRLLRKMV